MNRRDRWWIAGAIIGGIGAAAMIWREMNRQPLPTAEEGRGTALITGASSGIGAAYARALAARGYDLILVARREARLRQLAQEVEARYGVHAEVLTADLTTAEGITRVAEAIRAEAKLVFLINNAGFGTKGFFFQTDVERQEAMVRIHVIAPLRLTHAALPAMVEARRGAIVNVASVAAFSPTAGHATYTGVKAFLVNFSEGLHEEVEEYGVRVQALCPGYTRTEFQKASGVPSKGIPDFLWLSPEAVVAQSLHDLEVGRVVSIPGWQYRLWVGLERLLPRSWIYAFGRFFHRARRGRG